MRLGIALLYVLLGPTVPQAVIREAFAENRLEEIIEAVNQTPRGKTMARLGFRLDPQALQFVPSNPDWQKEGPMITAQWTRAD